MFSISPTRPPHTHTRPQENATTRLERFVFTGVLAYFPRHTLVTARIKP